MRLEFIVVSFILMLIVLFVLLSMLGIIPDIPGMILNMSSSASP